MLWAAFSDKVALCVVCTLLAFTGKGVSRPRNILLGTGTDNLYTRDDSNQCDITSDAPLPRLPTLGLLSTCTVAVSMYPRGSANKVSFPSGGVRVFGTLHSDLSHSLGSNLRLVSQICLHG